MHRARARRLKPLLDELVASHDAEGRRATDPVSFVHAFEDDGDREVVGLIAATLAFGNVVAVRASVRRVLDVLGPKPAEAIASRSRAELSASLAGFRHRVYRGDDVAVMLSNAAGLRRSRGSLGAAFADGLLAGESVHEALAVFADALRGNEPSRGLAHLVPDPRKGSASKRLWLYLRWMVRANDGVDLGIWDVSPSLLIVPVDTHILRIGQNLGLTSRTDASLRTAEEITASLRALDPEDPVRYDFALCHLGVSRACPSRREDAICQLCALRTVCLAYAAGADQSRKKGASLSSSRRRISRDSS